jgi:S-DNA-T family DNA segregation ATPase FtsK/SpoIIIE
MRSMAGRTKKKPPIKHWSHSSLMAFLRNPLAWYKRYVEDVRDTPSTPAAVVGKAGHYALEKFYTGATKEVSIAKGLEYLRDIADFEIDFGRAKSRLAKKKKREAMEREYLQAVGYYLARAPRHKVVGAEVMGLVEVEGFPLPLKAISDLVIESRIESGAVDIVDHKFVASFSPKGAAKTLFVMQALFNYYTVRELFGRPVRRFIVYECKKTKNADGSSQLRRYEIDFEKCAAEFEIFRRLIIDATAEITRPRVYLPNPSDMFEGENSFDIYRLQLLED